MEDFIFTPIVLAVGFAIHIAILRRHTAREGRILTIAFLAHVASGFLQVLLVTYYFKGGGDMLAYFANGVEVAELMRSDFARFAPEVLNGLLQRDEVRLPVPLFGGGPTMSMSASAAFILFVVGNSLYAATALIAVFSYVSQVLLFSALRRHFPASYHHSLLVGATLLPSAVFWSSALLKEPLVMIALGPLVLGLSLLAEKRRRLLALVVLALSVMLMALIKPYVLMALSLAAGVFYLLVRLRGRESAALKPFALITAAALAFGGLVVGSRYFAKAEEEGAAASLASQRAAGYGNQGGSSYFLEQPAEAGEVSKRTLAEELALAPVALVTAFFRPFLFEARNAVQLANALEATYLLFLFFQVIRRRGWGGSVAAVQRSPALMFCFVFAFALALGTGLASTNLGTLSRYRAPMMPFFFTLLLVLRQVPKTEAAEVAPVLSPAGAGQ